MDEERREGQTDAAAADGGDASARQWYIIHTYSGFENKVKQSLRQRADAYGMGDKIGEILVPTEEVVELRDGKKITTRKKFFPGYVLVHMEMSDEAWHVVRSTPKVTGFVGGATDTPSISETEVRQIAQQVEEGAVKPKPKMFFETNENVKVVDGPFQDFNGVVEEVKPEKQKVRVKVSIFGRSTPVELDFSQVEKKRA